LLQKGLFCYVLYSIYWTIFIFTIISENKHHLIVCLFKVSNKA
jgi:hypothetical protein